MLSVPAPEPLHSLFCLQVHLRYPCGSSTSPLCVCSNVISARPSLVAIFRSIIPASHLEFLPSLSLLYFPPLHLLPSTMIFLMSYLLRLIPLECKLLQDRDFGLLIHWSIPQAPEEWLINVTFQWLIKSKDPSREMTIRERKSQKKKKEAGTATPI